MGSVIYTNPPRWRKIKRAVLRRDGYRCRLMLPGCTGFATTVDHWIPRVDEGTDDFDNLKAACSHCNVRKGSSSPVFLEEHRLQNARQGKISPFFTPIEHRTDADD